MKNPSTLRLMLIGFALCLLTWGVTGFIAGLQLAWLDVNGKDITRPITIRNEFGHRPDVWLWFTDPGAFDWYKYYDDSFIDG